MMIKCIKILIRCTSGTPSQGDLLKQVTILTIILITKNKKVSKISDNV